MLENNIINSGEIKKFAVGQAVVETRVPIESNDGGGECKLLSASAHVVTTPSEVFAGEVRYAGKVKFDILVLCDGKVECMSAVAEFTDKITSPDIVGGMNVALTSDVINCESAMERGAIKVVAVVDTAVYGVVGSTVEPISGADDGVFTYNKAVEYCSLVTSATENTYTSDSVPCGKAEEILCSYSRVVLTNAECGDDEVKITGNVFTFVTMRGADGKVSYERVTTPFIKSVGLSGVVAEDVAVCRATVTDSSALLVTDDECRIETAATVQIYITVFARKTCEIAVDAFSPTHAVETEAVNIPTFSIEPSVTVMDVIDGQIKLEADMPAADGIVAVGNTFCTVTNAHIDGRVNVEGLVGGDIVYYNTDRGAVDTVSFRLPFSMPIAIDTNAQDVDLSAVVTDVTVRIRRESVFDVKAEIAFTATCTTCGSATALKSVKVGEEIARPDATVIVHIARPGETLWQAAKALGCPPDRVTEQNSASAPYAGGERLVHFCGK
ncbi:MAG: DUF3794 domain-containing protein [Clostridiales bacterium]|nr:DUF3794 domain-containing protein [Clostridiales bacterium]